MTTPLHPYGRGATSPGAPERGGTLRIVGNSDIDHLSTSSGYYLSTIRGLKAYCDAFAKAPGTVEGIKRSLDTHEISGVHTTDDSTIVFELTQPASDFLNLIAMPFISAMPIEYRRPPIWRP